MATYQVIQRGEAINLLYFNGTQMPIPLGISVPAKYFDAKAKEGKWISKQHAEADSLNVVIQTRLNELRDHCNRHFLDKYKYPAPKSLKNFFTRGTGAREFYELYAAFMQHKTHMGLDSVGLRTYKGYSTTLKYMKEYRPALELADITPTFYDRFKQWLVAEKGLTRPNSIGMHIKVLKTFLHWLEEHEDIVISRRTMAYMKADKKLSDVIHHTAEEIQQLIDVNLQLLPYLEPARDAYLLLCLTGLRISDFTTAEWQIYGDVLHKPANKTREAINLPLHSAAKTIIEKYTQQGKPVPKLSEPVFNRHIKAIGRLAKITAPVVMVKGKRKLQPGTVVPKCDLMTTHIGRSTFICMLIESDVHFEKIMKMTGIKSLSTLKHYADAVDKSLQEAMHRVQEKQQLRVTYKKTA